MLALPAKKMGAGTSLPPKKPFKDRVKRRFTAMRIAFMAIFVALSLSISLLSFSIFPTSVVFFLELDFGNVFILLISFLLGPIEGVVVCVLKESLRIFAGSTGGVGELANMESISLLLPIQSRTWFVN